MKQSGLECGVSYQNINLSLLMYTSYFVLFARYGPCVGKPSPPQ
jgi:hypothetical protein